MSSLAIKYLKFADFRHSIQNKYDVQSYEQQILRVITQNNFQGTPLRVRNLLDMTCIASPATIHKAMKLLISKGFLKVEMDKTDGRIKYLVPTPRTIKLFTEIGKAM